MAANPAGKGYYYDGCPLCRAQMAADKEGRPVRMRDLLTAVRKGKK